MSVARHQQLIDAIGSGDPDTAQRAFDAHMRHAARTLLRPTAQDPDTSA
jgi:DNA-binding FadR family transcriptional regulator